MGPSSALCGATAGRARGRGPLQRRRRSLLCAPGLRLVACDPAVGPQTEALGQLAEPAALQLARRTGRAGHGDDTIEQLAARLGSSGSRSGKVMSAAASSIRTLKYCSRMSYLNQDFPDSTFH